MPIQYYDFDLLIERALEEYDKAIILDPHNTGGWLRLKK